MNMMKVTEGRTNVHPGKKTFPHALRRRRRADQKDAGNNKYNAHHGCSKIFGALNSGAPQCSDRQSGCHIKDPVRRARMETIRGAL
ncbi:hypothetical protein [Breoghania sp. L-A4]|uniref:hypothetical protein n=1 Tax=Breoghania sp. L-A4 TaxID=2304600 RepID=UPI0013C3159D|nr:hypothetical protein [Breoghania sp. L-A4]